LRGEQENEEERKMTNRKKETRICLNEFYAKPVIRNEVIFSYLTNHSNWYIQDQLSIKNVERISEQTTESLMIFCNSLIDDTDLTPDEKSQVLEKVTTSFTSLAVSTSKA